MSIPFTAARARNEGFRALKKSQLDVKFVQFIDGDCQLQNNWLNTAIDFLEENEGYAAVCGRRREMYPKYSIYNQLCDIEWNTPVGDTNACGGDVLMRASALEAADGYNDSVIAGEEPELCFRLRQSNWKIARIDHEMTLHDADIRHFSQWWKRTKRAGYAYTNGWLMHGRSEERYNQRPVFRIILWGLAFPVAALLGLALISPLALILLLLYPLQWYRITQTGKHDKHLNQQWAFFLVIGKFPECLGLVECLRDRILSKNSAIIEYK